MHIQVEGARREVMPGSSGVDFVVPRVGYLRCRAVADDDGKAVEAFWFRGRGKDSGFDPIPHRAPGPDGYRTDSLSQGSHVLVAYARGFGRVLQTVEIGNTVAEVTLRLPRATTITVQLAAGASVPPAGLRVKLIEEAFDAMGVDPRLPLFGVEAVDLAKGGTFTDIAPGHHRLESSDDTCVLVPAFLDVVAGRPATFELQWRRR